MTHHVESLKLESQILEQKSKHKQMADYQSTISHEFKTPLISSLMFLETLLAMKLTEEALQLVKFVVS